VPTRMHEAETSLELGAVRVDALNVAEMLADRLDRHGWTGFDPYDGLTSPVARLLGSPRSRQVLIQGVRRSPVNPRGALAIHERRMAMATGLAASGAARMASDAAWAERSRRLACWTAQRQIANGPWRGLWGYEFDVQTRWAFYAAGSPNMVATVFAADGCLDAGLLGAERLSWLAEGLLATFHRGPHFGYTAASQILIHNANLLGASLTARLAATESLNPALRDRLCHAAQAAVEASLERQRPDGSWPYGEAPGLQWVDGFHTAYTLLRLDQVAERIGLDVEAALDKGTSFYLKRLFAGAMPLYHPAPRPGGNDVNNVATGLRAAVWAASSGRAAPTLPHRVFRNFHKKFWDRKGYFRASTSRWKPAARIDYPRWGGAPALDALTALACWERGRREGAATY